MSEEKAFLCIWIKLRFGVDVDPESETYKRLASAWSNDAFYTPTLNDLVTLRAQVSRFSKRR